MTKYGIGSSTVSGWARKLNIPRRTSIYLDNNLELSEKQKEILIGSLLGDGSLNKIKPNTKCQSHFEESHSLDQLGWLKWKHEILLPLSSKIFYKKNKGVLNLPFGKLSVDNTRCHDGCRFNTINHPSLTEMERQWYKRDENGDYVYKVTNNKNYRIKIVPEFELTKLALAIWFIDDGSNDQKTKNCKLSTQCFTKEEVELLIEKIKKLGIHDCYIGIHTGWVIKIGTYSYLDFINLVKEQLPELPQNVQYKVDLSEYNPVAKWTDNKTGIPFFKFNNKKYDGRVMINYKSIYLGAYNYNTAQKISKEVEYLVRHKCKNPEEFIAIKNKHSN